MPNSKRRFRNVSQSSEPPSHEHRLIRVELIMEDHEVRISSIEERPSRSQQVLASLAILREILPWCLGLGMLAAAVAGRLPWESIGEALK